MNRCLVTGGSGFIGLRVVRLLAKAGYEVHAISRNRPVPEAFRSYTLDLLDETVAGDIIDTVRPRTLFPFAWATEHGRFWTDASNDRWKDATMRLVERFLQIGGEVVVGVGTCAEYLWDGSVCREYSTPLRPATPYGASKMALSQAIESACARYDARNAWGRVFFAYGSGEPPTKLLPSLVRAAKNGEPLAVKQPYRRLDFIHADDVARAFVTLAASEGRGAFNIACGVGVALEQLAVAVGVAVEEEPSIQCETPASRDPDVVADISRISALGWRPEVSLSQGIRESIAAR
jgi:nucleoside-diphosphate-sugar epimerase